MMYADELMKTIKEWSKTPIEDEWVFETFRRKVIGALSPPEAFDSMGETVDILVKQKDESTATEILQCMISLVRQCKTTEVHPLLLENKGVIIEKFQNYDAYSVNKLKEFFRYYNW